jgi:hypothetical protein
MVRLISLLFVLFVLYLSIKAYQEKSNEPFTYKQPSIITVEELPPIREDNDN